MTARPLLDLLKPGGAWPDFLDSFSPDLAQGLEEVRATPRAVLRSELSRDWRDRPGRPPTWIRNLAGGDRESLELVVRALRDLHHAVVAPRWDNAIAVFHADVARRIPVLAAGGHEELFGTLHPLLRWDAKTEFVQAIKLSMDMVGRYGGPCRPPRQPLTAQQEAEVRVATENALAQGCA